MIENPNEEVGELSRLDYWKPTDRQIEFAKLPYSIFEGFYGGALGGGKSELLLMLPILYKMHEHPRFHGIFFRRTLSQQDETLILRAKYLYGKVGAVFNEQKRIFTFPSGAILRYTYLERDAHARDHDGAEYHYVAFDELTHFSKFQYIYITTRIRSSTSELPVIIRCASNPGNIGHAWVRERFIEPCKQGGKILKDKKGNKRIFIKSLLKDNPYITREDPEYLNRLELTKEVSEAEYRAKVDGDWWVFSGQVFTEFRDEKRDHEPENAIHVIPDGKIPLYYPRIAALDWGYTAETYLILGAIAPNRRVYIEREYFISKATISTWGREIAGILYPHLDSLKTIVVDPSARKHDGQNEKSIFEQIAEALGDGLKEKLEYANNDRIAGKLAIHELLRWKQLPKVKEIKGEFNVTLYNSLYRNISPAAARAYQDSFLQEPDELFIPRLQIFESCDKLIKTIPLCTYNEEKQGGSRSRKKYEDIAEFAGDDPIDTLRYFSKAVDRYCDEIFRHDQKLQKLDAIHQRLQQTGDQTSFYLNMRMLEQAEKDKNKYQSVSRSRITRH